MTPEETKHYLEQRLIALGWSVHIGNTGYEKIFRFTEGNEDGARRLYHKLLALGGLQDSREINDDLIDMAMIDLAAVEAPVARSASEGDRRSEAVPDLASIEQLAAVLEAKMADGGVEEVRLPKERPRGHESARPERSTAPKLPAALVVDASPTARARAVEALAHDFTVTEASDGEEAWKLLLERPDIELMVSGLELPTIDGYELIRRAREASRPHLAALPILALAGEEAGAKLRALTVGANDVVISDAPIKELRARALSRHRLRQSLAQANRVRAEARAAREMRTDRGEGRAARPAKNAGAPRARAPSRPALATLHAEPRFPHRESVVAARAPGEGARESVIRNVYRVSATTTITLSATALLAVAILTIMYVGRGTNESSRSVVSSRPTEAATAPLVHQAPQTNTAPSTDSANRTTPTDIESSTSETGSSAGPAPSASPPTAKEPERADVAPRPSHRNSNARSDREQRPAAAKAEDESVAPEPASKSRTRADATSAPTATVTPTPPTVNSTPPAVTPTPSTPTPPTTSTAQAPPTEPARPEASKSQTPTVPPTPNSNVDSTARAVAPDAGTPDSANAPGPTAAIRPGAVTPAPAPTPPAVSTKISRDELATFLRRFAAIYENGDADQFVGLFADNARTNDRIGRKGIRDDYETLFRSTDLRRMKLGQMSWEIDGNQAYGWGDFDVTVRRSTDRETYAYSGSMTFVLEKVDGRLRIVRLYHDQRRAGARD